MSFQHKIHYNCKICRRPGIAMADSDCPADQIDILAKGLCCDICFDAREKIQHATHAIFSACHFVMHAATFKNPDKVRSKAFEILEAKALEYAKAVCAQYRSPLVYSEDFPNQLFRTPEKAGSALAFYRRSIETL